MKTKFLTPRASYSMLVRLGGAAAMLATAVGLLAAPILTLTSNVGIFNFGRYNVGTVSPGPVIMFSNSGTAGTITISSVSITGANAGDFAVTNTSCTNATLQSGGTCTATVSFTPLLVGARAADLTVVDDADGSQHSDSAQWHRAQSRAPK